MATQLLPEEQDSNHGQLTTPEARVVFSCLFSALLVQAQLATVYSAVEEENWPEKAFTPLRDFSTALCTINQSHLPIPPRLA